MKLAPFLPFDPAETSFSYASRLAALHTDMNAGRLFSDFEIKLALFHAGDRYATSQLAEVAGVDPALVLHNTFSFERHDKQARRTFRGNTFTMSLIRYAGLKVCPECLMEDEADNSHLPPAAAWRTRYLWHFRPFLSCPRHRRQLVRLADSWPARRNQELPHLLASTELKPEKLLDRSPCRQISPLQTYLQNRIEGAPTSGGAWLDAQTLEQAVEACEVLGLAFVSNGKASFSDVTPERWDEAGAIGFEHARKGPEAVKELLDRVCEIYPSPARQPPDRSNYGPLYLWLKGHYRRSDLGAVLDVVREHMLKRIPMPPGTKLFGKTLERRNLHSVQSLARERGMTPGRVRGMLEDHELISSDERMKGNAQTIFTAAAGEAIMDGLSNAILQIDLPAYLNCRYSVARKLADDGILKPASHGSSAAIKRGHGRQRVQFRRQDLDDFLRRLASATTIADHDDPEFVDIHTATKHAGCTATQILSDILAGELRTAKRMSELGGIDAIRVSISDVAACRRRLSPPDGMNFSQAMKFLGVSIPTLAALTSDEHGPPLLPTYIPETKFGDGVRRYIRLSDLEGFAREYVTIRELSRAHGGSLRALQNQLAREGVVEIRPRKELHTSIYRRADVCSRG